MQSSGDGQLRTGAENEGDQLAGKKGPGDQQLLRLPAAVQCQQTTQCDQTEWKVGEKEGGHHSAPEGSVAGQVEGAEKVVLAQKVGQLAVQHFSLLLLLQLAVFIQKQCQAFLSDTVDTGDQNCACQNADAGEEDDNLKDAEELEECHWEVKRHPEKTAQRVVIEKELLSEGK